MEWHVGSSGFSYDAWVGPFYPTELPGAERLAYYASRLSAVEINNTFYRMPRASVLADWAVRVPAGFRFALKAPRRITHGKKDDDPSDSIQHLFRTVASLGETLGPILFQLPPWARKDVGRLRAMLALAPPDRRVAFEFRHASWLDDEVYAALGDANAALCIADFDEPEKRIPLVATAPFGYLRLRAATYDDAQLGAWVETLRAQSWQECFVFFKHEDAGAAPLLARRMLAIANGLPLEAEAPIPVPVAAPPIERKPARVRRPAAKPRKTGEAS